LGDVHVCVCVCVFFLSGEFLHYIYIV